MSFLLVGRNWCKVLFSSMHQIASDHVIDSDKKTMIVLFYSQFDRFRINSPDSSSHMTSRVATRMHCRQRLVGLTTYSWNYSQSTGTKTPTLKQRNMLWVTWWTHECIWWLCLNYLDYLENLSKLVGPFDLHILLSTYMVCKLSAKTQLLAILPKIILISQEENTINPQIKREVSKCFLWQVQ